MMSICPHCFKDIEMRPRSFHCCDNMPKPTKPVYMREYHCFYCRHVETETCEEAYYKSFSKLDNTPRLRRSLTHKCREGVISVMVETSVTKYVDGYLSD